MRFAAAHRAALLLGVALVVVASLAGAQQPQGVPQPDAAVRDPDFGVRARHFGLERRVEMYQWQRAGQGYVRTWSAQAIDSSGFAPGHDNPPFPLQSRRWQAKVTLDGKPLDPHALATLGRWQAFNPSFNALPGNLAASFQPQGDGLGSALNPLDPEVGDLRIRWRDLELPPLQGRLVLRDGHWQLAPGALAPNAAQGGDDAGPVTRQGCAWLFGARAWWLLGVVVVLAIALTAVVVRRRTRKR